MTVDEGALSAAVQVGGLPRVHTRRIIEAYEQARRERVPGEQVQASSQEIPDAMLGSPCAPSELNLSEGQEERDGPVFDTADVLIAHLNRGEELGEVEAVGLMACAYDAYETHRPSNYFALQDAYRALAAVAEIRRRA